nr:A202 [uncultured bacterium]
MPYSKKTATGARALATDGRLLVRFLQYSFPLRCIAGLSLKLFAVGFD